MIDLVKGIQSINCDIPISQIFESTIVDIKRDVTRLVEECQQRCEKHGIDFDQFRIPE